MNENFLDSYDYDLPEGLIATEPLMPKHNARLLVYNRAKDSITHTHFGEFFNFIPKDCLIVLNDTKVLRARIYGKKPSGARLELLYHKNLGDKKCSVQIRGKVKVGDIIEFEMPKNCDFSGAKVIAKVLELQDSGLRIVEFSKNGEILDKNGILNLLSQIGHIPLPPYIKRPDNAKDLSDYQSVFAKEIGSIAAPTASLHFDDSDLEWIKSQNHCFITLHIGAGTFFSVESSDIREHKMHSEDFCIAESAKNSLDNAKKILCIGTTATRCVEFYARSGQTSGECDIFINPLNPPIKTDFLLTNFHLPKSTLIMLVAGFIGLSKTKEIYQIAIEKNYRFYSYGDGMLIV